MIFSACILTTLPMMLFMRGRIPSAFRCAVARGRMVMQEIGVNFGVYLWDLVSTLSSLLFSRRSHLCIAWSLLTFCVMLLHGSVDLHSECYSASAVVYVVCVGRWAAGGRGLNHEYHESFV